MVEIVEQVTTTHKRKRFNKNKKKAWRRKTDISEVERQLEDQRREERHGGPLEERKDSELMFVDLGPDEGKGGTTQKDQGSEECFLEYTVDEVPQDTGKIKLKPRKVKLKTPKLKSHQFINGLPGAKPPRKPRKNAGTLTKAMKKKVEVRAKDPKLINKQKEAFKQMLEDVKKIQEKPKGVIRTNYTKDLWGEDETVVQDCKKKGLEESFIGGILNYYQRERKIKPVNVPKLRQVKTSKINAVVPPHAGTSYNPSYQSHQKLLRRAMRQEEKYLKRIEKVERATTRMFPTIDKAPTEESWLVEMSEGLPNASDEGKEEEEEEENEEKVEEESEEKVEEESEEKVEEENEEKVEFENAETKEESKVEDEETLQLQEKGKQSVEQSTGSKPVKSKQQKTTKTILDDITVSMKPKTERKTKKIRRKEKKLKLQKIKKLKEKQDRIRNSNIYKIKTYQKEIAKEEQKAQERTVSHRALKEQLMSMPRRLGKLKFEEEEIAVKLGDELPGSLRHVRPAVELFEDRFKNLQRRNLIETRNKHKLKRKYKPKVVLKRGHREELAKIEGMDFSD